MWTEYEDWEIVWAWEQDGQGNRDARQRGRWCYVIACDLDQAIALSRLFVRNVFAVRTCCHYDGKTLSMYCGDAGGNAHLALAKAKDVCGRFLRGEIGATFHEGFA
jgi:hypothetical protein